LAKEIDLMYVGKVDRRVGYILVLDSF